MLELYGPLRLPAADPQLQAESSRCRCSRPSHLTEPAGAGAAASPAEGSTGRLHEQLVERVRVLRAGPPYPPLTGADRLAFAEEQVLELPEASPRRYARYRADTCLPRPTMPTKTDAVQPAPWHGPSCAGSSLPSWARAGRSTLHVLPKGHLMTQPSSPLPTFVVESTSPDGTKRERRMNARDADHAQELWTQQFGWKGETIRNIVPAARMADVAGEPSPPAGEAAGGAAGAKAVGKKANPPLTRGQKTGCGCLTLIALGLLFAGCGALFGSDSSKTSSSSRPSVAATTESPAATPATEAAAPTTQAAPTLTGPALVKHDITDKLGKLNRAGKRIDYTAIKTGSNINVKFACNDNLTSGLIRAGCRDDVKQIIGVVKQDAHFRYADLAVLATFPLQDKLGNASEQVVIKAVYHRSTVNRINLDNLFGAQVIDAADTSFVHPTFQ